MNYRPDSRNATSVWSEKLLSTFIFYAYHDNNKYEEHTIIWIKDALPFTFVCGTRFYRHKLPGGNPLTRIAHVFVATIHKWNILNKVAVIEEREVLKSGSSRQYLSIDKFR